jgi:hypothetical protein
MVSEIYDTIINKIKTWLIYMSVTEDVSTCTKLEHQVLEFEYPISGIWKAVSSQEVSIWPFRLVWLQMKVKQVTTQ